MPPTYASVPASCPCFARDGFNNKVTNSLTPAQTDRLINEHKDAVYRSLVRMCGLKEDAEDVLIEAMLAAYKFSGQLEQPAAFRSWLTTIAKRICTRLKVKQGHLKSVSLNQLQELGFDFPAAVVDEPSTGELDECLKRSLASMKEKYRLIYTLREVEGKEFEAIAKEVGLTVPGVKSRLLRARQQLRVCLDGDLRQPQ